MGADDRRLLHVLSILIKDRSPDTIRDILNVGAGRCDECDWLRRMFPHASLTLLDRDPDVIRGLLESSLAEADAVVIVQEEAARYLSNKPVMYDLIIVRHPNINDDRQDWQVVFHAISTSLSANGVMLGSFFSIEEMRFVRRITADWVDGVTTTRFVGLNPVQLAGRDRYILMYTRRGLEI